MENIPKLIKTSMKRLGESKRTFADIYSVMLSHSDKIMIERDEGVRQASYTYAQVDALVKRAAFSIKEMGCSGEYIGVYGKADLEWIVLFYAVLMSGNKPFLINVNLSASSVESQLKTLGVRLIVTDKQTEKFSVKKVAYPSLIGSKSIENPVFGDEFALSTSGTGLKEKICVYTGKELSEQILNAKYIADNCKTIKKHYKGRLKVLLFLPLYHIFGLTAGFLWFAFFGRTFVPLADYSATTILRTIKKYKVTHVLAVPLLWQTIEKTIAREVKDRGEKTEKKFYKGLDFSIKLQSVFPSLGRAFARKAFKEVNDKLFGDSVFFCVTGGSYIKQSTLKLINGLGYELHNGYGMSETGITSYEMSLKAKDRITTSIGKPLPSVEYKTDEENVLYVKGTTTCGTLIVNGEKTALDDWFCTGDIVNKLDNGAYEIVGRKSDLVIGDNGENISPDAVEQKFSVEKAVAFSVLGDENKKSLIMVVQLPENMFSANVKAIDDGIKATNDALPVAERVTKIYYTYDAIKSPESIKVSRAKLTKDVSCGRIKLFDIGDILNGNTEESVGTEIGDILKTLFAEALGVDADKITADANFFSDLGGSSLEYFSLIAAINEKFSINIRFDEGHLAYTLSQMEKTVADILR